MDAPPGMPGLKTWKKWSGFAVLFPTLDFLEIVFKFEQYKFSTLYFLETVRWPVAVVKMHEPLHVS
jgi:hypothetical protein